MSSLPPTWKYNPKTTGLVLIDVVNDFLAENGKAYPLVKDALHKIGTIENIKKMLDTARENEIAIFYSGMSYTDLDYNTWQYPSGIHKKMFEKRMFEAGSWGADWLPQLAPRKDKDVICHPHMNIDAFATTDLEAQLRQHDIQDIVIAGMSSTLCVQSTARTAMERGFRVTAVRDASAAIGPPEVHDFVMNHEYPVISHAVISASEFASKIGSKTKTAIAD